MNRTMSVKLEPQKKLHTASLNIDEIDVVSGGMNHGPESHGIGNLAMEPDVFVGGEEPSHMRPDETDDVPQHGDEDEGSIDGENQASTTGNPYGEEKGVETGELGVGILVKK